MKCVCVCLFGFGREEEKEKKRVTLIRYFLGSMSCMHGDPTNKNEVAQKSTLLSSCFEVGSRIREREGNFWAFGV